MNIGIILSFISAINAIFNSSTYQIIKPLVGLLIKLVELLIKWLEKKSGISMENKNEKTNTATVGPNEKCYSGA